MANTLVNQLIGFNVTISRKDNAEALYGKLLDVDIFGILVRAKAGHDEVKENVVVYLPHEEVAMIHAFDLENDGNVTALFNN